MVITHKTYSSSKKASLLSFRQRLSYVLALLFVFGSFNPAQAGMAMGQGMMNTDMTINDAVYEPVIDFNNLFQSSVHASTSSPSHIMNMTMGPGDDCQSDCDCCPGLCAVYLPTTLSSANFLPANFVLADSACQGKVSTITRLFRPPISH